MKGLRRDTRYVLVFDSFMFCGRSGSCSFCNGRILPDPPFAEESVRKRDAFLCAEGYLLGRRERG